MSFFPSQYLYESGETLLIVDRTIMVNARHANNLSLINPSVEHLLTILLLFILLSLLLIITLIKTIIDCQYHIWLQDQFSIWSANVHDYV